MIWFRLIVASGSIVMLSAAVALFAPVLPGMRDVPQPAADETPPAAAPRTFTELGPRFDRSVLPAPTAESLHAVMAAGQPDPAAQLRNYRYLGMARADGRETGLFANDGATRILKPGETLEGLTLQIVDHTSAKFGAGSGEEVYLRLVGNKP